VRTAPHLRLAACLLGVAAHQRIRRPDPRPMMARALRTVAGAIAIASEATSVRCRWLQST